MVKVNVIGSFFSNDGYGVHTRKLANALYQEGVDISITTNRPADWERWVNDNELKMLLKDSNEADINLVISTPNQWLSFMVDNKPFIGFLVWEGSHIPKGWLSTLEDERVNQIWVPSNHVKEAVYNTFTDMYLGVPLQIVQKIKVVPHGVDINLFEPGTKTNPKFTFLMSGGWPHSWRDRKGLSYGIKAFMEEFTKEENVRMLVKVNTVYGINLEKNMKDLDIQNKNTPELGFITNTINYDELPKLYHEGDVFLSTSKAEGFNLPCLEAMACGIPVISTSYGGQTDYITDLNGWLLEEGELKENQWDVMYEGVKWMEPNIDEIRKMLRKVYNEYKGEKLQACIETSLNMTWQTSALEGKKYLEELNATISS